MTHWRFRAAIPLIAAFLLAAALATPAIAQDTGTAVTAELPAGLSQTELEGLIARMTDAEVRQVLIKQLEVIAAQSPSKNLAALPVFSIIWKCKHCGCVNAGSKCLAQLTRCRQHLSWPTID